MNTTTLYRPVGPEELELIRLSDWKAFPPRFPEQPIFYPVTNEAYAIQIARDWNVRDSGSGYVTEFAVDKDFLSRFAVQQEWEEKFTRSYGSPLRNLMSSTATLWGPSRSFTHSPNHELTTNH
jgi:hypothetical protein